MAMRIRTVDDGTPYGTVVALCAVETDEQEGDLYLDDTIHHAIFDKFCHELLGYDRDPVAESQKLRDAEEEMIKWQAEQHTKAPIGVENEEGLKPCKQCGEIDDISRVKCFGSQAGVQCDSCGTLLGPYETIEEAVKAWNLWCDSGKDALNLK